MKTDINKQLNEFNVFINHDGFNSNTKKYYGKYINEFLAHHPKSKAAFDEVSVFDYIVNKIELEDLSDNKRQLLFGAFNIFFNKVGGCNYLSLVIAQLYPLNKIPVVLDKEEIKKLFDYTKNIKHKVLFELAYTCGLKPTNVLHLKTEDIYMKKKIIILNDLNGKFMRELQISDHLLLMIYEYRKSYVPKIWLFEGEDEEMYSRHSAEIAFIKVLHRCKINKKATLQTLRHSFAVHLLDGGMDIHEVQIILGLKTERSLINYPLLSKIKVIDILGTLGKQ